MWNAVIQIHLQLHISSTKFRTMKLVNRAATFLIALRKYFELVILTVKLHRFTSLHFFFKDKLSGGIQATFHWLN